MDSTQKPLTIPPEYSVYAEKHSLFDFFKSVLEELSIHKPKDPLQRIIEICERKNNQVPRVFIFGPPSSGKKTLSKLIARKLKCKFINPSILFKDCQTVEGETELTTDQKVNAISQNVHKSDVLTRGWVISNFPTTPEEAHLLQARGILADHVVFLEGSKSVLQERSSGKRVDSLTGDIYHFPLNMPDNQDVIARLGEVPEAGVVFQDEWIFYHRHLESLQQCYDSREKPLKNIYNIFSVDQPLQSLSCQVFEFLSQHPFRSLSPVIPRVLLLGVPGSGKNTQAAMLAEKYNLVNIDFDLVLKETMRAGGALVDRMKLFVKRNLTVPTELLIKVLLPRLSTLETAKRGWVLHSFPITGEEAQSLSQEGIIPNRVVYLDVSRDVVIERLTLRRIDPVTGHTYHTLYNPAPNEMVSARLLTHPQDQEEVVTQKLSRFESYQSEIREVYEAVSKHVNGEQDPHAVFECVETFIVNELSQSYNQPETDM